MQCEDSTTNWKGRQCVLASKHEKERVIGPILEARLGISLIVPSNFDTDRFGTFTREIRRTGNQLEATRAKARAAMEHTGHDMAIASEGSFGTHPSIPFLPSSLEIVILIDARNAIEIIGQHRTSDVIAQGKEVYTPDEAVNTALAWGFPNQGVIVRSSPRSSRNIHKEIRTIDALRDVSTYMLSRWFVRSIYLETDMRAHRCPGRMESIRKATLDLVQRCTSLCPQCGTPGFGVSEVVRGLPCSFCGRPTDLMKETVSTCQRCSYTETQPRTDTTHADPGECPWCNP
jgi:hypothetical protein